MMLKTRPTVSEARQMRRESASYPVKLVEIPCDEWPAPVDGDDRLRILRNRKFLVQVFDTGGHIRMTVNRTEWDPRADCWRAGITWDELQGLKQEAGYGDLCAVEVYPPDDAVVNLANMRHLWFCDEPPFMWKPRR